jgi:hypothetical protein
MTKPLVDEAIDQDPFHRHQGLQHAFLPCRAAFVVSQPPSLLAARAPKLRKAVRDAKRAGHAYVILDGTLIPIDRVARDRPFYSGKHKKHGMNLQVIASPDGDILWVSGALPGSVHDKRAEWIWGVLDELEAAGLVTLADKGYQGSTWAKIPYKGKKKPESQKQANRAHAKLRGPGERANAQLKNWQILRKLRCCPWRAGNWRSYPRTAAPPGITRMESVQCLTLIVNHFMANDTVSHHSRRILGVSADDVVESVSFRA